MNSEVIIFPYVTHFTLAYAIALVIVAVIMEVFNIDGGQGGSIGSLLAAVMYSVSTFVKDQKRIPNTSERQWLTWSSLIASILVSLILILGFLGFVNQLSLLKQLPILVSQVGTGMIAGITIFVLGLYALVLWFSYGWFAKMQYRALEKKGEI